MIEIQTNAVAGKHRGSRTNQSWLHTISATLDRVYVVMQEDLVGEILRFIIITTIKPLFYFCLLFLLGLYFLTGCGLGTTSFGNWTVRLPEDENYFYAVGGPKDERIEANDQARVEMAKIISVTVDSEIELVAIEQSGLVETTVVDQIRIQAKETMKNVSIVEVRKSLQGYHSLARMPRRPIEDILDSLRFKKVPPTATEISRSVILPGWGQIQKQQTKKGLGILSAQAVSIGGMVLFSILKSSANEQMIYSRTAGARQAHRNEAQRFAVLMVSSLVTASAIYIYNLVDVMAVPKKVPLKPE